MTDDEGTVFELSDDSDDDTESCHTAASADEDLVPPGNAGAIVRSAWSDDSSDEANAQSTARWDSSRGKRRRPPPLQFKHNERQTPQGEKLLTESPPTAIVNRPPPSGSASHLPSGNDDAAITTVSYQVDLNDFEWSPLSEQQMSSWGDDGRTTQMKSEDSNCDGNVQASIRALKDATRPRYLEFIDQAGLRWDLDDIQGPYRRLSLGRPRDFDPSEVPRNFDPFEVRPSSAVHSSSTFNHDRVRDKPGSASKPLKVEPETRGTGIWQLAQKPRVYTPPSIPWEPARRDRYVPSLPSLPEEPESAKRRSTPKRGPAWGASDEESTEFEL